jgi:hypothetical protein
VVHSNHPKFQIGNLANLILSNHSNGCAVLSALRLNGTKVVSDGSFFLYPPSSGNSTVICLKPREKKTGLSFIRMDDFVYAFCKPVDTLLLWVI